MVELSKARFVMPRLEQARLSRLFWVVLAVAVASRLAVALIMGDRIEALPGIQDQVSYHALAERLLGGYGFSFDRGWYPFTAPNTPTAHWSFAYPLYLAAVYLVTGQHPLAPRLLQAALSGVLMVWLTYRLGSRLFDRQVGLVAAAWAGLYPYFIYYSAALMTEAFFIVGLLAVVDLLLEFRTRPRLATGVKLGLVLGLTTLLRQTLLPVAPLLLLLVAWEKRSKLPWAGLAGIVVAFAILIAPFTIRNGRVYGRFLLLNSNAGYALWASNHPSQGSYWQPKLETAIVPIPPEWLGANEAVLDRTLTQNALKTMLADPLRTLALAGSKAVEQFKFWPDPATPLLSNLTRILSFALALPFMLVGLALTARKWKFLLPVYLIIVAYNALFLLSWPSARYRLATDALLLVLAAYAAVGTLQQLPTTRRWLSKIG